MKFRNILMLIVVLIVSGCATNTSVRQHADFANGTKKIVKLGIIKPDVVFTELAADGDNKRIDDKEKTLAYFIPQKASQILSDKGYGVQMVDLDVLETDYPDIRIDLQVIRDALANAKKNLYEKPATVEESRKFRENLGSESNVFAQLLNLDALLLTEYNGWEKTGGSIALDVAKSAVLALLTGVVATPQTQGESVSLSLIETKTGDLLWTNSGYHAGVDGNSVVNALNLLQRQGADVTLEEKKKK